MIYLCDYLYCETIVELYFVGWCDFMLVVLILSGCSHILLLLCHVIIYVCRLVVNRTLVIVRFDILKFRKKYRFRNRLNIFPS
jgi:hypothetical protein